MDITFHYPPELLQLLIDAVPKLCKSKKDLLLFFQGAGVPKEILRPYDDLLLANKTAFNKYPVTREILTKINEQGEVGLRTRREVLKRVTEFEDFSVCWDNDQAAARGLVAQIRGVVNVKDSFTRMRNEKDEEKRRRQEEKDAEARALTARNAKKEGVKNALFSLFGEADAHKRGKALEKVLNDLFGVYGISVREAFTVKGKCGEGVIEQIDGLIELEGHNYLVEMKWWNAPIGVGDVAPHLVRIFGRGGQVRGVFISYSEFTEPAIVQCRDAIANGAVMVMASLQELVELLNSDRELKGWLKTKVNAAIVDKQPYFKC
ncbi:MAG: restriction endonuclease [Gammaproteobacteria bacterium]|nr:restriction endonuclease [Gammaproteobacteria bacterium]MBU0814132.1 restriction endonuclease [Gammaproteobacteria bacterium]MBU1786348.1 restriction endonuclease [Gammaproteobacteria bacterium]